MSGFGARARPAGIRREWWLAVAALCALGLGIGLSADTSRQLVGLIAEIVLVLLAAGAFVYALGARVGLLGLLVVTCMLDRFSVPAGSVNVRSEQLAAMLGLAYVAYMAFAHRGRPGLWRPNRVEVLLGLWLASGLISSVLFAPSVSHSVKGVGLLAVSALGVVLPRRVIDEGGTDDERFGLAVRVFLVAFAAEAAYGTAVWLLHAFGPTISISANAATGHYSAYGTLWEPNVFGACCAAGAVAWTWLGPRYFRVAWIGIGACLAGTLVSFTRAAWLAVIVVLALSILGPLRRSVTRRQFLFGLGAALVVAILVAAAEHTGHYYLPAKAGGPSGAPAPSRSASNVLANEVDVLGRLDQLFVAAPDIQSHLWLGNGTATYGVKHTASGLDEHIASLELAVLYDTGVVGLLIFMCFMAAVAWEAWKFRRDSVVAGLGMTALVFAITNTATETTELMITWLLVGMLLMAVDAAKRARQPQVAAPQLRSA